MLQNANSVTVFFQLKIEREQRFKIRQKFQYLIPHPEYDMIRALVMFVYLELGGLTETFGLKIHEKSGFVVLALIVGHSEPVKGFNQNLRVKF